MEFEYRIYEKVLLSPKSMTYFELTYIIDTTQGR